MSDDWKGSPLTEPRTVGDDCEFRARWLLAALNSRGTKAFLWDRSPWGVRIPLTPDHDEYAPALFVLTEGKETVAGKPDTWVWFGQLGHFGDSAEGFNMLLTGTDFRWIERHWLGSHVDDIAEAVIAVVRILTDGAAKVLEEVADEAQAGDE